MLKWQEATDNILEPGRERTKDQEAIAKKRKQDLMPCFVSLQHTSPVMTGQALEGDENKQQERNSRCFSLKNNY
jgi:hypothetical protein